LCVLFFVLHATATTEIYTLSLHDALPIYDDPELAEGVPDESGPLDRRRGPVEDRGPDERGLEDQPHRRIDDGDLPDLIVVREDREPRLVARPVRDGPVSVPLVATVAVSHGQGHIEGGGRVDVEEERIAGDLSEGEGRDAVELVA